MGDPLLGLLRTHVRRGANELMQLSIDAALREPPLDSLRDLEVNHPWHPCGINIVESDQDVRRLYIPVNDPLLVRMLNVVWSVLGERPMVTPLQGLGTLWIYFAPNPYQRRERGVHSYHLIELACVAGWKRGSKSHEDKMKIRGADNLIAGAL